MKYAAEFSSSLSRTTTTAICATGLLTWFFSAMQCNREYCYTTDNPVTQVALAGTLAFATVMAATSAPVTKIITPYLVAPATEKINQAKTYFAGVFSSKKPAEVKTVDAAPAEVAASTAEASTTEASTAETPIAEQKAALPRTGSGIFTPKSDSVQANASETTHSPHNNTPPPSPTSPTHP